MSQSRKLSKLFSLIFTRMSYSLLSTTKYDPFLTSLRYNDEPGGKQSPFFLLSYHLDRLLDAALQHGWNCSLTYDQLKSKCEEAAQEFQRHNGLEPCKVHYSFLSSQFHLRGPGKIRLVLDNSGFLHSFSFPVSPFSSDPTAASLFNPTIDNALQFHLATKVYVDSQPTPVSIFTRTKTTRRQLYDQARSRAGISPPPSEPSDVLLYNPQLCITEASVCNVAFWRLSKWVTPPTSSGCLAGVLRRWLLEQGRIVEADEGSLTKETIQDGDWVLLMNGVIGCQLGIVVCARNP